MLESDARPLISPADVPSRLVALGAAATTGGVLRGHLVFTSAMNPRRLATERRRTRRATRLLDLLVAALLSIDVVGAGDRCS